MNDLLNYKIILWDFDGVILESNEIRELGFTRVLSDFPEEARNELLRFHRSNGGLSRYVKFKYFFENILDCHVREDVILEYSKQFSEIMKTSLVSKRLLIEDNIELIRKHWSTKSMFIVSGSDQEELRYLCKELDIAKYFKEILGSPVPKNELVCRLLKENRLDPDDCVLVGDSINDLEAASHNNISFIPYNYVDPNKINL
jgi:HAD superfamily hydrolase (TIGR01549 family)